MATVSSRIQRAIQRSLESIFRLDAIGDPLLFERRVVPVWNVEPLIAGRTDYTWIVGTAAPGAGAEGTITFLVPANEEWHVAIAGAQKPTTVTPAPPPWFVIRPIGSPLAAGLGYGVGVNSSPNLTMSAAHAQGYYFNPPLVLGSGESLIARWPNNEAGPATFHAGVLRRIITLGA